MIHFNEEQTKDIIEMYNTGMSANNIGTKFGVGEKPIYRILKNNNVEIVNNGLYKTIYPISDLDLLSAYNDYITNKSMNGLQEKYRVPTSALSSKFIRAGYKLLSVVECQRKYSFNEDFFSEITLASSYWAGFIAADGCISDRIGNSKTLTITLSEKDKEHIEKLREIIGYTGPISKRIAKIKKPVLKEYGAYSMSIISNSICNALGRVFNIYPRKTYNLFPPDISDYGCKIEFARGLIDGDGNISNKSISLCNTKSICYWLLYLVKSHGIETAVIPHKIKRTKSAYVVVFYGNRLSKKVCDFIYSKAPESCRLERKYNKAMELICQ